MGGIDAGGVAGLADTVLHLRDVAFDLGRGRNPVEGVFQRQVDFGPMLEVRAAADRGGRESAKSSVNDAAGTWLRTT